MGLSVVSRPKRANGLRSYTTSALAFGMEALIPTEVGLQTRRTKDFDMETTTKELDLTKGRRDLARIKIAKYQQALGGATTSRFGLVHSKSVIG